MPSLRRSLLRRYRLFAPYLFRHGLALLLLLLIGDGLSVFYFPQMRAALSLNAPLTPGPTVNSGALRLTALTSNLASIVRASDTFQRPDQHYWGVASDGQSWQDDALNGHNFVIFAHMGVIEATAQRIYCNALLGPVLTNSEIIYNASLGQYGPSMLGAALRWSDARNFYALALDGQTLTLTRVMDGMEIPLRSVSFPARAGALYTFRFRALGTQLFAMAWPTGQPAPANWQISTADSALTSGRAGLRVLVQRGTQARITAFEEVQL
ncbi:MAG TPA: hypothetical protein VGD98_16255 [Ktedonobacteraceae bacterium]